MLQVAEIQLFMLYGHTVLIEVEKTQMKLDKKSIFFLNNFWISENGINYKYE